MLLIYSRDEYKYRTRRNIISPHPNKSMSNRSSVTYRRDFVPPADIRVRSPRSHRGSPDRGLARFVIRCSVLIPASKLSFSSHITYISFKTRCSVKRSFVLPLPLTGPCFNGPSRPLPLEWARATLVLPGPVLAALLGTWPFLPCNL